MSALEALLKKYKGEAASTAQRYETPLMLLAVPSCCGESGFVFAHQMHRTGSGNGSLERAAQGNLVQMFDNGARDYCVGVGRHWSTGLLRRLDTGARGQGVGVGSATGAGRGGGGAGGVGGGGDCGRGNGSQGGSGGHACGGAGAHYRLGQCSWSVLWRQQSSERWRSSAQLRFCERYRWRRGSQLVMEREGVIQVSEERAAAVALQFALEAA